MGSRNKTRFIWRRPRSFICQVAFSLGFQSQEWRRNCSASKPKFKFYVSSAKFKPSSTDHPTFNRIIHSLSSPNNSIAMSNPLCAQVILKKGYAINTHQLLAKSPYHFSSFFIEQSPDHKRNEIQLPPLVTIFALKLY